MSGEVQQPGHNPFDAAELARIQNSNGGKINTVQAVRQIEAAMRRDGQIEASELALLDQCVTNMVNTAHADFEVQAAGVAFDVLNTMRPQQTMPGSQVTGTPPRFADPLRMANDVGQLDELDATTADESRCAATTVGYELCFQSPDTMQAVIDSVRTDPHVPQEVKDGLRGVDVRQGNVSRQTFHLMVEGLHNIFRAIDPARAGSGVSGHVVAAMLRVAKLSDGTVSNSPPSGLQVGQRALVMGAFKPGSAAHHWRVVGRDTQGYYCIDPYTGNNRSGRSTGNSVRRFGSEAEMQAYLRARNMDFGAERAPGGPARGVVTLPIRPPSP